MLSPPVTGGGKWLASFRGKSNLEAEDMQVHRQTCQACGSIDVRNILARETNKPTIVYVRCRKCSELVAYYELSGYYHHGKGIESYLQAQGVSAADSGRAWLAEFNRIQEEALSGYEAALQKLTEENKEV